MRTYIFSALFLLLFLLSAAFCKESNDLVIAYSSDESGNPDIYLTDTEGKSKVKLTDYEERDGYPSFSPDGKKIVFYAYHGKTWSIHSMNTDGSDRKRLTNAENKWDNSPVWYSDGKQIVFGREYGETMELWTMNADGSGKKQLPIEGGGPCITPDNRILYHSKYEDSEICIADADGTNIRQLTDNEAEDWHPEISQDGKQVAFMSDRDGNYEIYVMNIDGSDQKRLTINESGDWEPSWSPDGSRIVFASDRDGDFDIYIMNIDGSAIINITDNEAKDIQPSWLKRQN